MPGKAETVPRKPQEPDGVRLSASHLSMALMTVTIGSAIYALVVGIAPKAYVDDGIAGARKYTDDRSAQVLKEAIAHSDRNHDDMVIRLTEISSAGKATNVKLDNVLESVKRLEDDTYRASHRKNR